jgi:hypothetical protein
MFKRMSKILNKIITTAVTAITVKNSFASEKWQKNQ